MDQGEADEAVACYRRALELKPDYAEAHNNLGIVLTAQGQLDEAVACGRRALELKPDYPEAHKTLADALWQQRKPGRSRRLLPAGPGTEARLCRGPQQPGQCPAGTGQGGRSDGLLSAGQQSTRETRQPDYIAERRTTTSGVALRGAGKAGRAAAACRRALELKPDYPEAHNNLGNALKDQGMVDEAEACWRRALELKPDFVQTHNSLGVALRQQGKLEEAIASYRRALELKPDYAEAYNNLANALWEQGKTPEAEACWRRTIELKPDCVDAYSNLGMMLYEKRRIADAAAVVRRWLRARPGEPHRPPHAGRLHGPGRAGAGRRRVRPQQLRSFRTDVRQEAQRLEYRAPELVMAAAAKALGDPKGELEVLDAGCGTGWCGPLLRPYARRLTGVDLSPAMIEKARARQVYDDLIVAELTAYLAAAAGSYDLIASADTLVYFGDLGPVFAAALGPCDPAAC